MANLGGNQTIRATRGKEEEAKVLYRELREIIKTNSKEKVNTVIKEIADVEPTSWANYISTGKVSEYVVTNLEKFSGLPREVFSCESEFGENERKQFADKIVEKYGDKEKQVVSERVTSNETEEDISNREDIQDTEVLICKIAEKISDVNSINSVEKMDSIILKLEKLVDLAKSSKTLLEKKLNF